MTLAISAQGSQFKRNGVLVPEIKTFNGPTATKAELPATSLDSQAHEFIAGLPDWGEFTVTMNWIPQHASHKALKADFDTGVTSAYTLTIPDPALTTLAFNAFVKTFPKSGAVDTILDAEVTFRLTGILTEAP